MSCDQTFMLNVPRTLLDPPPTHSFHPQHVSSTRAVATVCAVAWPISGEQHESIWSSCCAGAPMWRAPAANKWRRGTVLDSCSCPCKHGTLFLGRWTLTFGTSSRPPRPLHVWLKVSTWPRHAKRIVLLRHEERRPHDIAMSWWEGGNVREIHAVEDPPGELDTIAVASATATVFFPYLPIQLATNQLQDFFFTFW